MTFRLTVIRSELSAWTCQPFCCQRTFALIPSGRPSIPLRALSSRLLQATCVAFNHRSNNKKPGVERRAKSPYRRLCAKLDYFLSSARKEPHYRVYFWPSLDPTLGRRFDPTVMPCWLNYPRATCKYTRFPQSVKPPTKTILGPSCAFLCKTHPRSSMLAQPEMACDSPLKSD